MTGTLLSQLDLVFFLGESGNVRDVGRMIGSLNGTKEVMINGKDK